MQIEGWDIDNDNHNHNDNNKAHSSVQDQCPKLKHVKIDYCLSNRSNMLTLEHKDKTIKLFDFISDTNVNVFNNVECIEWAGLKNCNILEIDNHFNWLKTNLPKNNVCSKLSELIFCVSNDIPRLGRGFEYSARILSKLIDLRNDSTLCENKCRIKYVTIKWSIRYPYHRSMDLKNGISDYLNSIENNGDNDNDHDSVSTISSTYIPTVAIDDTLVKSLSNRQENPLFDENLDIVFIDTDLSKSSIADIHFNVIKWIGKKLNQINPGLFELDRPPNVSKNDGNLDCCLQLNMCLSS